MKKFFSKRYGIYHLRWQLSAIVMMPIMLFLEAHLPLWGNLMLGQFVGALIFWEVDKRIFGHHDKDTTETEITKVLEPSVSERKL